MNTPPTKKRHIDKPLEIIPGSYNPGLHGSKYPPVFAQIVTMFVHLGITMQDVLAVLLRDNDAGAAGFVWRSVMSAKARIDLMVNLLEKGRPNRDLGVEYDEIIREFKSINNARNDYVHGLWMTGKSRKMAYLTKPRDDTGTGWLETKPEPIENLIALRDRIHKLDFRITRIASAELQRRKFASQPRQSHEHASYRRTPQSR
jgi:hypothetical protein